MPRDPRRAAAQQLSALRSAGVTRIPRRAATTAPVPSVEPATAPGPVAAAAEVASSPAPVPKAVPPCAAGATGLFDAKRSTLGRGEREQRLLDVAARVKECTRCAE